MINLLQKYICGDASDDEKMKVIRWINASQENRREYMALRKIYDIQLWNDAANEEKPLKLSSSKNRMNIIYREALKLVAVFALAFGVFQLLHFSSNDELQSVYTPEGQRAELTLADGTKVWLNAKSKLTYPTNFNGRSRDVVLDGEGYFSVTKNEKKPFIVHTKQYDIRVVGTEFNVMAYQQSGFFETSLIRGAVQVVTPHSVVYKLSPNRKIYSQNGKLYEEDIKYFDHFLWRKGLICFNNESVADIIKKMEIYYDVTIIVKNNALLNNRYTGKFRMKEGVEHVLKVLQLKHRFKYIKDEEENIITII